MEYTRGLNVRVPSAVRITYVRSTSMHASLSCHINDCARARTYVDVIPVCIMSRHGQAGYANGQAATHIVVFPDCIYAKRSGAWGMHMVFPIRMRECKYNLYMYSTSFADRLRNDTRVGFNVVSFPDPTSRARKRPHLLGGGVWARD